MAQYRAAYLVVDSILAATVMVDRSLLFKGNKGKRPQDTKPLIKEATAPPKSKKNASKTEKHSSKGDSEEETDKKILATSRPVARESIFISLFAGNLSIQLLSAGCFLAMTALHVYDMLVLRPDAFAQPLSPSERRLAALSLLSSSLRLWAISTLGSLFTFTVHAPTKLIETGPYELLIHPSYTGLFGWMLFRFAFMIDEKSPIFAIFLRVWDGLDLRNVLASVDWTNAFAVLDLTWFAATISFGFAALLLPVALHKRILYEEEKLKETFGDAWTAYKSKRWRLIPFLF